MGVILLKALQLVLEVVESKLCRNVWQLWEVWLCEQPVTKHSSSIKLLEARHTCIFMQADVHTCAGRIPERPHHCDAQTDAAPSSDSADHVG